MMHTCHSLSLEKSSPFFPCLNFPISKLGPLRESLLPPISISGKDGTLTGTYGIHGTPSTFSASHCNCLYPWADRRHLRGHGWGCVPVLHALCLDGYMMSLTSAHSSPWPKAYIMCSLWALFYFSPLSLTLIYSLWLPSCPHTTHALTLPHSVPSVWIALPEDMALPVTPSLSLLKWSPAQWGLPCICYLKLQPYLPPFLIPSTLSPFSHTIEYFFLGSLSVVCYPTWHKFHKSKVFWMFYSLKYLKHLEWCLEDSRQSINSCWINKCLLYTDTYLHTFIYTIFS